MSYLGLLNQTGLTMNITRTAFLSKNEYGEQVTEQAVIATGIPVRKQTLRQEDLMEGDIPTDIASIKWLLFAPIDCGLRNADRLTFNRQPSTVTYYNVIHGADATEEQHHLECIIEEIYQD